tara:strand:- start:843 stop:3032 length:2190 start_codon:yes stop_codon:yes gene_type:complete
LISVALLICSSLLSALAQAQPYKHLPKNLPSHYGVIGVDVLDHREGVILARVFPNGPAESAGLRPDDRIIAIDGYRISSTDALSRYIQSIHPGSRAQVTFQRNGEQAKRSVEVTDVGHLYGFMRSEGPTLFPDARRHIQWRDSSSQIEDIVLNWAQTYGATPALDSLREALHRETERYGADARLSDIHYLLNNPLKTAQATDHIAAELKRTLTIGDYLNLAGHHLDLEPQKLKPPPLPTSLTVDQLLEFLTHTAAQVDSAFVHLTSTERQLLVDSTPFLLAHFAKHGRLDRGTRSEYEACLSALTLAKKVDLQPFLLAAAQLEQLVAILRKSSALHYPQEPFQTPNGLSGPLLYARETPLGWILIGSNKTNFYGRDDILCIIELGGDDIYAMAPPSSKKPSVRLYIDYGGNDHYLGESGSAVGGIEFVVNYEGNDLYTGNSMAQGFSFCGIGLLWDSAGNDQYISKRLAQGAAFFGAGLLIDDAGSDLYVLGHKGQGLGGMLGWGLLADQSGEDLYLADHHAPSTYGVEREFAGWAQGVGFGFRGQGSGGIGILYDREGNDRYQAGEFSQGLGYFFALGVLYDQAGDDVYRGRRYAQGASAHQAIGVLFDARGNDRYRAKTASQGAGWDASIGLLRDDEGDDEYRAGHLSQGAAAMNSWGLLVDRQGRDRYEALSGQGLGGSVKYWGGRRAQNVGGLVDIGDQPDRYNQVERSDGHTAYSLGIGLFLDQ